jgi:flagellar protein FliO/FliZ
MALDTTAAPALAAPGMSNAWEVVIGLVLVIAVIIAVGWLMRRLYPGAAGGSGQLRVLAALPLGPRERLLLVDAAGKQLLLGVTTQQITALHQFTEALPRVEPRPAEFALRLREVLGGGSRQ